MIRQAVNTAILKFVSIVVVCICHTVTAGLVLVCICHIVTAGLVLVCICHIVTAGLVLVCICHIVTAGLVLVCICHIVTAGLVLVCICHIVTAGLVLVCICHIVTAGLRSLLCITSLTCVEPNFFIVTLLMLRVNSVTRFLPCQMSQLQKKDDSSRRLTTFLCEQ